MIFLTNKKITPSTIGERIKIKRLELGLTRKQLANKCDIKLAILGHYETNTRTPPPPKMKLLAKNLNVSLHWLNFGTEVLQFTVPISNISAPTLTSSKLPVLTWENILLFPEGLDMGLIEVQDFEPVIDNEFSTGCFCVDVEGDSMVSGNFGRSFVPGCRLYVNPTLQPKPGDFVIAKINKNNTAVFRQYIVDSGSVYLKPLNVQYPVIQKTEDVQIIGVVIKVSESLL